MYFGIHVCGVKYVFVSKFKTPTSLSVRFYEECSVSNEENIGNLRDTVMVAMLIEKLLQIINKSDNLHSVLVYSKKLLTS